MQYSFTLQQISKIAATFVSDIGSAKVVAIYGQMGAGKTTFISAVTKALGSVDLVSSPTYSIINQYRTISGNIIYHMDLYRLNSSEEAIQAGVEDAFYSGNICLIEWPEKAADLLPDDCIHVAFTVLPDGQRQINY